ncbi:hypothetical protein [Caballeronia sp. LZ043]|uniref:hypothetical protein n=1 Tax=Caballeronia sp. LZ043 TaxID=3038569 RepID=UPI00286CE626|nr:hypothetical protein [Caballeronia sp. LZ043]
MSSRAASGDADNAMWGKNGSLEMLFCALLNRAPGGCEQARARPRRKRLQKTQKQLSQLLGTMTNQRKLYLEMIPKRAVGDPDTSSITTPSELKLSGKNPYKLLSFRSTQNGLRKKLAGACRCHADNQHTQRLSRIEHRNPEKADTRHFPKKMS